MVNMVPLRHTLIVASYTKTVRRIYCSQMLMERKESLIQRKYSTVKW